MSGLTFGLLRSRDTPRQARAVARVHAILQATADVLVTRSPQDLSTTAIAAKADIPVSSIYRYFPTLDDVLRELYLQTAGELRAALFAVFEDVQRYPQWRDRLRAVVRIQRAYLAKHPYYRALLIRFMVQRGPLAVEEEEHPELVEFLCDRWTRGLEGFQGGDPRAVATTAVQIALTMEDLIAAQPDLQSTQIYSQEMALALEGYLATYLND